MTFFGPLTPLRVFRVVLFVKVITILASLLVALAVGDRTAQQHLSLAMFLAILMLILFGANGVEARLGVSALAVGVGNSFAGARMGTHAALTRTKPVDQLRRG
jgi:dolichol kinase